MPDTVVEPNGKRAAATWSAPLPRGTAGLRYAKLASGRDGMLLERGIVSQDTDGAARSACNEACAACACRCGFPARP
ncbi:hypothetical protein [Paraburkholderia lycopersici]|uniref:Uncharacterized protein n=1 Tax=Paraburkholderia lycopersici TaxID=416944 RepID=A0A1G6QW41_9BURK|nr:hypothetical protein [Paraburkholderia lycopersici]SDC96015.1 hypothetical protein SAMN05421548_112119 [Paraburkholderia lycopersici]